MTVSKRRLIALVDLKNLFVRAGHLSFTGDDEWMEPYKITQLLTVPKKNMLVVSKLWLAGTCEGSDRA